MKKEQKQILAAAVALFAHKGIKGVSVDEIVRSCNLSKRNFYVYFDGKESLVHTIICHWIEKSEKYLSLNSYVASNAISELTNFFQSMESIAHHIRPLFFQELRKYYTPSWEYLESFREASLVPFLVLNINRGLTEEIYRHNTNSLLAAKIYFAHLEMVLDEGCMPAVTPDKVLHEINTFLLHGLVNLRGMKLIYEKTMT